MGVCSPGSSQDLLLAGVGLAVEQVLAHGSVEQEGVLQHHGHLPAQRAKLHPPQIVAIDQDLAVGRVVEAAQ